METGPLGETEDEQHLRLLRSLRKRLADIEAAHASGSPRPPLAVEEEADEATREVLNDPEMITGLIEGIEDVMAGRVITLEEFRAEQRRSAAEGQSAAD